MNTITLKNLNQSSYNILKANGVIKLVTVLTLAFAAGVFTVIKPIALLLIPVTAVLLTVVKLVVIFKEVVSMKFDTDGLELTQEEILQDLYL